MKVIDETRKITKQQWDSLTPPERMPRLERWFRCEGILDFMFGAYHVHGIVYDHPKVSDGAFIATSDVVMFSPAMNILETKNCVYRLVGPEVEPYNVPGE